MPEIIERTAKLFEAGDYPDKGLKVTEADLDTLISGFTSAQVKIEHTDSPFDGSLGNVTTIWRDGAELKGKIGFPSDAWSLIDRAGAKKLSVGIAKDFSMLKEVSLVQNPRVQGATVFDDRIEMTTGVLDELYFSSWGNLTADNIKEQIRTLLNMNSMEVSKYIDDLGQDFCIIEDMSNNKYTRYDYSITNGVVSLGTSQEVLKQEKWIPVTMAVNQIPAEPSGGINMADKQNGAPTEGAVNFTDEQKATIAQTLKEFGESLETKFSDKITTLTNDVVRLSSENEALRKTNREKDVQFKIDELKRAGRLTPAMEPMAKELLMAGTGEVTFNGEQTNQAALVEKMLNALPKTVSFSEQGETTGETDTINMSAEEALYFEKITGKKPGQEAK